MTTWHTEPLGDRALVVEFGRRTDAAVNAVVRAFAQQLIDAPIGGIVDVVPAFTTVAVHYRPERFDTQGRAPFETLCELLDRLLTRGVGLRHDAQRTIEVPVHYGGEDGPDLERVADACGFSPAEVIARHGASDHVVTMLGFAPGFPYIGGLDPALSVPRLGTPRTRVPAGSVAVANDQSAIYSLETPGGWNLIGRTALVMFDPAREPACLLQPGDRIRFVRAEAPP